uniref:Uncharacterized protein n=1 Tax=Arundo donax TaxID=35708 RepID=A0A0A9HA46_ARUDO
MPNCTSWTLATSAGEYGNLASISAPLGGAAAASHHHLGFQIAAPPPPTSPGPDPRPRELALAASSGCGFWRLNPVESNGSTRADRPRLREA